MADKTETRGRKATTTITDHQRRTLREIDQYVRRHGFPPSIQELADILGITPASVHDQVNQLVRKGYLQRAAGKARGLAVVRRPDDAVSRLVKVRLMGNVAAGVPILADENIVGEVLVESSTVGTGHCFALNVTGDSMKNANIRNGDVVIVRQQPLAETGDIVVALVNGEATIKRLYIGEQTIELRPENKKYRPITIGLDTDLRILGKVVAVHNAPQS